MFTADNKNLCMRYTVCSLILQYAGFSYCLCYNCYMSPPVDLDIIYTHWNQLKVKRPTLIITLQCTALPGNLCNHLGFQLDLIHSLKCWRPTEITKKQWRLPARGCASQIAKTAQKQLEEQVKEASAWTWTPKQSGSTSNQASVECTGTNRIHRDSRSATHRIWRDPLSICRCQIPQDNPRGPVSIPQWPMYIIVSPNQFSKNY